MWRRELIPDSIRLGPTAVWSAAAAVCVECSRRCCRVQGWHDLRPARVRSNVRSELGCVIVNVGYMLCNSRGTARALCETECVRMKHGPYIPAYSGRSLGHECVGVGVSHRQAGM